MPVVAHVVGARPQFVKAAPISRALAEAEVEELLVHTGQHYDPLLSGRIFHDVGLREPDLNLGVGSASHAIQTGRIMERIEAVLLERRPSLVVTYGDTNSTVAAALAAAKIGIVTAHVEAGLRSFNRRMPEEINRVVTDRVSDLLLAPTELAMRNLEAEGLGNSSVLTGDVMVDALRSIDYERVEVPDWANGQFQVATIHRAENTDDMQRLRAIVETLEAMDHPVHLLVHPRLRQRLGESGIAPAGAVHPHPPLSYGEMLAVVRRSEGVITDSGGLQKEAYILGTPCITLRPETEWPETLEGGWNILADPADSLSTLAQRTPDPHRAEPFGDGLAAPRVVEALVDLIDKTDGLRVRSGIG